MLSLVLIVFVFAAVVVVLALAVVGILIFRKKSPKTNPQQIDSANVIDVTPKDVE